MLSSFARDLLRKVEENPVIPPNANGRVITGRTTVQEAEGLREVIVINGKQCSRMNGEHFTWCAPVNLADLNGNRYWRKLGRPNQKLIAIIDEELGNGSEDAGA